MEDRASAAASDRNDRPGERRQVSVLYTDMVGFTAIVETLGEERASLFTARLHEILVGEVKAAGGAVQGFAGDSVMAVFGMPLALEEPALQACRAGVAIHRALAAAAGEMEARWSVRPQMRVGISSGPMVMAVLESAGAPSMAVGSTVNLASRIQALAAPGDVLICDATRAQVEWRVDLAFEGEREIRGLSRPQKLWRLLALRDGARRFDASLARGLSPLVGRSGELARMEAMLGQSANACRVADVVAEAGMGKTRLVFEFLRRLPQGQVLVLTGQCSQDGQKTPFLPFLEVLRGSLRLDPSDEPDEIARRLEGALRPAGLYSPQAVALLLNLLGQPAPREALEGLDGVLIGLRTRDLLQALLRAQCRLGPVVMSIDDIHWIDGASQDLLERLIAADAPANLMVVLTRRPEYRPAWEGRDGVEQLALEPMADDDIRDLVQSRLGGRSFPPALLAIVTERAGGNPFFGEEVLSLLIQQGQLRLGGETVEFDAVAAEAAPPASVRNLLAARVDQLEPGDRALVQVAAVIGRRFDPGLLAMAAGREDVGAVLQRLQARDVVLREPGSSDFAFRHVLMRDSVYQGLLSERRATLHLAVAEALERRHSNRLIEAAESLAFHYSRTGARSLAFRFGAMAAQKALGVYSLDEAADHFAAALALYQEDATCASDAEVAGMLAGYALCLNIGMRYRVMFDMAETARALFVRMGDSRDHVHFLHHYLACLVGDARYKQAAAVRDELTAMAERLGDGDARAYALVSEVALSCYYGSLPLEVFQAKSAAAEAPLADRDDPYLKNYLVAHAGYDMLCRGLVREANAMAARMVERGDATQDARALGYGTAMKALIALCTDDYDIALDMSDQAMRICRVEFERQIAHASRYAALVPLGRPGAEAEADAFLAHCAQQCWTMMGSGPETMQGLALVLRGRIGEGIARLEAVVRRRESEGAMTSANWARLYLCEVYLAILSGQGGASTAVLLRNAGALARVILFGGRRIEEMVASVKAHPHFHAEGHYIARAELILGLLARTRKKKDKARAHLAEALRIVAPAGSSQMRSRIETALAELG